MFIVVQGWVYTQPDLQLVISNPYAAINMGMGIVLKLLGINLLLLMFTAMIGLNVMQLVLKPDTGESRLIPPAIGPLERRFMWKYIQLLLSFVVLSFTLILIASM